MLEMLENLLEMIQSLIDFVVMVIESFIKALAMIPEFLSTITLSVAYLPTFLTVFASLTVSFLVINYIIGRQG